MYKYVLLKQFRQDNFNSILLNLKTTMTTTLFKMAFVPLSYPLFFTSGTTIGKSKASLEKISISRTLKYQCLFTWVVMS